MKNNIKILTINETAIFLHRSPAAVRGLVKRGAIPYRKIGGRVSFLEHEITAWVMKSPGVRLEQVQS